MQDATAYWVRLMRGWMGERWKTGGVWRARRGFERWPVNEMMVVRPLPLSEWAKWISK
jgi:hypothetical protein